IKGGADAAVSASPMCPSLVPASQFPGKRILAANRPFVALAYAETIARLELSTGMKFYCSVHQHLPFADEIFSLSAGVGKTGRLERLGKRDVVALEREICHVSRPCYGAGSGTPWVRS